ncbi:unnamed protein product [Trichobilharzia szidati]|nr:unnamed protein product [Trichobilharzia szidati]
MNTVKFRYTKDSRKCLTKIPSQTNWRKRHGMTLRCGPFFSRTHNGLLNSPYQSDVSQSAPSSPTIDTYETLPLVPNAASIARVPVNLHSSTDANQMNTMATATTTATAYNNSLHYDHRNYAHNPCQESIPGTVFNSGDSDRQSETMLLCLMQRLGVQSVWPCLLEHGVADVKRLSRLTRNELIEMGVTDAETRATLMTAAQLLTDSWLNPSLFHKTLNKPIEKNSTDLSDPQNIHDSGISSGTDIGSSYLSYKPQTTGVFKHPIEPTTSAAAAGHFQAVTSCEPQYSDQNQQRWNFGRKQCNTAQNSPARMNPYEDMKAYKHVSQTLHPNHQIVCMNPTDKTFHQNTSNASNEAHCQSKHPVSILRNGRLPRDNHSDARCSDSMKRSSSTTPKTVKIDERFLSSPRQQKQQPQQQQIQESNLSNYHQIPIQLASPLPPPPPPVASTQGYFVQYSQTSHPPSLPLPPTPSFQQYHPSQPQLQPQPQPPQPPQSYHNHHQHQQQQISNSMQSIGHDNTRNIYIQHIHLARHMLKKKLKAEGIDLTQPPYSDETGRANIPLRLIQRYSFETNLDLMTVAMAIEAERDTTLREMRRPVISFNDEITSQRFLNCDGIKTGSLQEFLVTIGLPMYINHILYYSISTNTTTNTTNNHNNSSITNNNNNNNNNSNSSSSSACGVAVNKTNKSNNNNNPNASNSRYGNKCIPMTPADLLRMSNSQLQEKFNFLPIHIQWLRQEASVIPWILLDQTHTTKSTNNNNNNNNNSNNMYSLPRLSNNNTNYNSNNNMNTSNGRSSSQLRKTQNQHYQQQSQHTEQQRSDNLMNLEHITDKV